MASDKSLHFGEFDLINTYFSRVNSSNRATQRFGKEILLGIGDDCALLEGPPTDSILAVTTDMLVENRHFFRDADPSLLGHKSLAVNLSDLAAMGAKPIAYTLSLALPSIDHTWLKGFSRGLHAIADRYECSLIGGDTTAGPLTISITALGVVPRNGALRRDAAHVGDDIWVSGEVGDARYVLGVLRQEWSGAAGWEHFLHRMHAPTPRVELGLKLRQIAHAAIDVSDGLLGDLRHILQASRANATIFVDQIPASLLLNKVSQDLRRSCTLRGGDDYELCFTAAPSESEKIERIGQELNLRLTKIGRITTDRFSSTPLQSTQNTPYGNFQLIDASGKELDSATTQQYVQSFDHFQTGSN
jgi:thiamine-monophosphate kinase